MFCSSSSGKASCELIYGGSACGHTNAGGTAALTRTQLEDPMLLLPTLERVRGDSLETEAVLVAPQNYVPMSNFSSSLSQREVMVVNFLHGAEFIS